MAECELVDRKTGEKATPTEEWVEGEYDVSDKVWPPPPTVEDYAAAKENAKSKARARCSDKYACEGKCDRDTELCFMDIEIVKERSGRLKEDWVLLPAEGFRPERRVLRRIVTYEIKYT